MHARWRFRQVDRRSVGTYAAVEGRPEELVGTDLEALARARELMSEKWLRVEAVSVGRPVDFTEVRRRILTFVAARSDGRGWMVQGELLPNAWYLSLEHAVSFAASRTVGYESETRILNVKGEVTHVVLFPGAKRK